MKRRLVPVAGLVLALTAAAAAVVPTPTSARQPDESAGSKAPAWHVVGRWDFSSPADLATWQHRNPAPDQRTTCRRKSTVAHSRTMNTSTNQVVKVSGGFLRLSVRKVECKNNKRVLYRSGHVGTESTFGLATTSPWRIQARIKFPESQGNHASLWTRAIGLPQDEVDIAETFGVRSGCPLKTNFYADYDDTTPGDKQVCLSGRKNVPKRPLKGFHFYRADIFPGDKAVIYVDGRKVFKFGTAHTPDLSSFMILSNLVNDGSRKKGTFGRKRVSGKHTQMLVDWISISTR